MFFLCLYIKNVLETELSHLYLTTVNFKQKHMEQDLFTCR